MGMKYQFEAARFPEEMHGYFACKFPEKIWELATDELMVASSVFLWQLDCPFWKTKKGRSFDLCPAEVILNPNSHAAHARRISEADTAYPLVVSEFGGTLVILDGLHRFAKLISELKTRVECLYVPATSLEQREILKIETLPHR
jgi:hypothetical protein